MELFSTFKLSNFQAILPRTFAYHRKILSRIYTISYFIKVFFDNISLRIKIYAIRNKWELNPNISAF